MKGLFGSCNLPDYNNFRLPTLPSELWLTILGFLEPSDLVNASQVNSQWNLLVQSNKTDWLWEKIVHKRWPHLEKIQNTWRETFIGLKQCRNISPPLFCHDGWNRRPIYDPTRLKVYYWDMRQHVIEWDIAKRQFVTHKMPQELWPYFKYNSAEVDTLTGNLFFVSCHTLIKTDLKNPPQIEIVSIAGHNNLPVHSNIKILKWNIFADLCYLNGCCIDIVHRRGYFVAVCKRALYILSANVDNFLTETSWCAVRVPIVLFPEHNQLANLVVIPDHTHDYICYLNVGERIFRVSCHPERFKVLSEVTVMNTNFSWPTMYLSDNGQSLYLVSANACNVMDVTQPNKITNVAMKLKNLRLNPSYKHFEIKASPCPGIDIERKIAYIAVCFVRTTNDGATIEAKRTIVTKVNLKTGKIANTIVLNDILCNLLWVFYDPHAGQHGRLYLVGARNGSIFLFKTIDLLK
jgi:hypothetical protein